VLTHPQLAETARAEVFRAASTLLPVSEELAAWLRRYPAGTNAIEVTPNGVDAARFAAVRPSTQRFTLGFVGGLRPWHGLADLAAIFAAVRAERADARLLVVGDGPGRAGLEADLAARGVLDRVTFSGAVSPDAVPGWLSAIDVALAPYATDASFYFSPLKLFEYMAAGRAIVASAIGQIASVVRHGETGWLHAPGDVGAAARAALGLAGNGALRAELGAAAQSWVAAHRSWDAIAARVVALAEAGLPPGRSTSARGQRLGLR
jgi:glycosyltransferase involved in cell wall biosynthesis